MQRLPYQDADDAGIQQQIGLVSATLMTAMQQLQSLQVQVSQRQFPSSLDYHTHQQQQQQQQHLSDLLQHAGTGFLARSTGGPWPRLTPPHAGQLLLGTGPSPFSQGGVALPLPLPLAASEPVSPAAAATGGSDGGGGSQLQQEQEQEQERPASTTVLQTTELPGETHAFGGGDSGGAAVDQVDQPDCGRTQQQHAAQDEEQSSPPPDGAFQQQHKADAAAGGVGAGAPPASSPVASEAIPSSSSSDTEGSKSVDSGGDGGDVSSSEREPSLSPRAAGAAGAAGDAEQPLDSLRVGEPEVVSGRRAACCTIVRLQEPGSKRTLGVYSNDVAVLGDTEDGRYLPNDDVPPELASGATEFIQEQQGYCLLMLLRQKQRLAALGWSLSGNADDDDDEDGSDGDNNGMMWQQQQQQGGGGAGEEELAWGDSESQEGDGGGVSGGEGDEDGQQQDEGAAGGRSSRKQQRPQRKSSAAAAAADGHGLLLLDEQDAAVDEAGAGHDATFASLLQHMSAAGVSMAAARSAAGGAGAADANAMPRGPVSAQRLAETRALVAEDVGRLAQEWMAANKSTLQAAAPDFWHSEHTKVANWRDGVQKLQARLDQATEKAVLDAATPEGYAQNRAHYCEMLHPTVESLEGYKFILSVAQLDQPPAPAPAAALGDDDSAAAAADGDGMPARKRRRGPNTQHDGSSADDVSSEGAQDDAGADGGVSSFIEDDGDAGEEAGGGAGKRGQAGAGSSDAAAAAAAVEGQPEGEDEEQERAWNVAHMAPGSTQVLVGRRLSWRAAHQQEQEQQQQQQEDRPQPELEQQQRPEAEGRTPSGSKDDAGQQQSGQQDAMEVVAEQDEHSPTSAATADQEHQQEQGEAAASPQGSDAAAAADTAAAAAAAAAEDVAMTDAADTEALDMPAAAAAAAEQGSAGGAAAAIETQPDLTQPPDDKQQRQQQPPDAEPPTAPPAASPPATAPVGVDDDEDDSVIELLESDDEDFVEPAAAITYGPPCVTVVTREDDPPLPVGEVQPGAPAELCVEVGGQEVVRWGKPVVSHTLPRWHSWQPCPRVVEVDGDKQTARVETPRGAVQQRKLGDVRPQPPVELVSLLPVAQISQHWQQQQQHSAGGDAAAVDTPLPAGAVSSWLCTAEGLRALSEVLRPGSLLEYQKTEGLPWVPAVVLHCSLAYSRQPGALQALLQEGFAAGADAAAAAEPVVAAGQHMPLPPWQQVAPDARVATVLLLNSADAAQVTVKHAHFKEVCTDRSRLRRMLHWRPAGSTPGAVAAILGENEEDDDDNNSGEGGDEADSSSSSQGWQVLAAFPVFQLQQAVQDMLKEETAAQLRSAGWEPGAPARSRSARKESDARLLQQGQVLSAISHKLARRPAAAEVPQRLRKALAGTGRRSIARWCAKKLPEEHAPPLDAAAAAAAAAADDNGDDTAVVRIKVEGGSASAGTGTGADSVSQQPQTSQQQQKKKRMKRRGVVIDSDSEAGTDGEEAKPKAKRQRRSKSQAANPSNANRGDSGHEPRESRSPEADDDAADEDAVMLLDDESQQAQERVRQREAHRSDILRRAAMQAAAAGGAGGDGLPEGRAVLFPGTPAAPLNPMLPLAWWKPGVQPADQPPNSLKPHQLEGLRFMWNCLVVEHAAADAAAAGGSGGGRQKKQRRSKDVLGAASDSDDEDSDLIDDPPRQEPVYVDDAGGCILAHSMGLGKSFQTVAMLWLFFQKHGGRGGRALLVVPTNVLRNWSEELGKWLPQSTDEDRPYSALKASGQHIFVVEKGKDLAELVPKWMKQEGSVLIISYKMFANAVLGRGSKKQRGGGGADAEEEAEGDDELQRESPAAAAAAAGGGQPRVPKRSAAELKIAHDLTHGPSIVVADEAHAMKNPATRDNRAMSKIATRRRLALTGYPLQNNLEEYYCMIDWVNPVGFMTYPEFKKSFIEPIQAGQERDATQYVKIKMAKKLSVLQDATAGFIQRMGPEILVRDLPPKLEVLLNFAPTAAQMHLLGSLMDIIGSHNRNTLRDTELMRKILDTRDHGRGPLQEMVEKAKEGQLVSIEAACDEQTSMVITPTKMPPGSRPAGPQQVLQLSQEGTVMAPPPSSTAAAHRTGGRKKATPAAAAGGGRKKKDRQLELPLPMAEALLQAFVEWDEQQRQQGDAAGSSAAAAAAAAAAGVGGGEVPLLPKEAFVLQLVRECCGTAAAPKDEKVVIFSQSMSVLTALGNLLRDQLGYLQDVHFMRLDGGSSAPQRSQMINNFKRDTSKSRVFLISTRAGSVGINLVAARRLVLYDQLWNPVHNKQAISRVWRYGQKQPSYIYHLIYEGTFETRVFERVLAKEELFLRVVDAQSKRAKLSDRDIDIYHVESNEPLALDALRRMIKGLFATAASQADERVLMGLVQQPALVRQLQLVGANNHAEQLLEDPTAQLSNEEKLNAALDDELDKRKAEGDPANMIPQQKGQRTKRSKRLTKQFQVNLEEALERRREARAREEEERRQAQAAAARQQLQSQLAQQERDRLMAARVAMQQQQQYRQQQTQPGQQPQQQRQQPLSQPPQPQLHLQRQAPQQQPHPPAPLQSFNSLPNLPAGAPAGTGLQPYHSQPQPQSQAQQQPRQPPQQPQQPLTMADVMQWRQQLAELRQQQQQQQTQPPILEQVANALGLTPVQAAVRAAAVRAAVAAEAQRAAAAAAAAAATGGGGGGHDGVVGAKRAFDSMAAAGGASAALLAGAQGQAAVVNIGVAGGAGGGGGGGVQQQQQHLPPYQQPGTHGVALPPVAAGVPGGHAAPQHATPQQHRVHVPMTGRAPGVTTAAGLLSGAEGQQQQPQLQHPVATGAGRGGGTHGPGPGVGTPSSMASGRTPEESIDLTDD